jgi:hypothetical protein
MRELSLVSPDHVNFIAALFPQPFSYPKESETAALNFLNQTAELLRSTGKEGVLINLVTGQLRGMTTKDPSVIDGLCTLLGGLQITEPSTARELIDALDALQLEDSCPNGVANLINQLKCSV